MVYLEIASLSIETYLSTENWDLLVDCTSRDGRQMLDAGVHLSDKRTLLMKTHIPFQTVQHSLPNPRK
jgi:hypothetical protein